jgi:hypothetical protein
MDLIFGIRVFLHTLFLLMIVNINAEDLNLIIRGRYWKLECTSFVGKLTALVHNTVILIDCMVLINLLIQQVPVVNLAWHCITVSSLCDKV